VFDCIHKARQALLTALADCDELADIMPIILADDKSHYLGFSLDCAVQVSYASKPDYKLDHKASMRAPVSIKLSDAFSLWGHFVTMRLISRMM
jgi:hypothetical protein